MIGHSLDQGINPGMPGLPMNTSSLSYLSCIYQYNCIYPCFNGKKDVKCTWRVMLYF
jgi:hypothetical protein